MSQAERDFEAAVRTVRTLAVALGILVVILALLGCTAYNPALYPSYDVLNPGPEVRLNPISVSEDPITHEPVFIVNAAFLQWTAELKQEILKLRKGAK